MDRALRPEERIRAAVGAIEWFAPPDPLRIVNLGDARPVLDLEYVIKGLLAPQHLGLLVGQPGCGTSALAPRIAHAVAKGEPILGRKTAHGPILLGWR